MKQKCPISEFSVLLLEKMLQICGCPFHMTVLEKFKCGRGGRIWNNESSIFLMLLDFLISMETVSIKRSSWKFNDSLGLEYIVATHQV